MRQKPYTPPQELLDELLIVNEQLEACDTEGKLELAEDRSVQFDIGFLAKRKEILESLFADRELENIWSTIERERCNDYREKATNFFIRKIRPHICLVDKIQELMMPEPAHELLNATERKEELKKIVDLGRFFAFLLKKYDLENSSGRMFEYFNDTELTGLRMKARDYHLFKGGDQLKSLHDYNEWEKETVKYYDREELEITHTETIETFRALLQVNQIASPSISDLISRFVIEIERDGFPERTNKRRNKNANRNFFVRKLADFYQENYGQVFFADISKIANCMLKKSLSGDDVRFIVK